MKFLAIRDVENVTSALNFKTADCHVIGGCDLYTTKAAGSDKKLYKNIEATLESQHASMMRLSASLSPPDAELLQESEALSSPFGPLNVKATHRTFAYLIGTLNASHPDYDLSHVVKPSDFRRERSLRAVMTQIDETMYNLRPRPANSVLAVPASWAGRGAANLPSTPSGGTLWNPRMWRVIDKELSMKDCEIYSYVPDEDPFEADDSAIWSLNYFLYNRTRKRVLYLYIRGLSITSHSPNLLSTSMHQKRSRPLSTLSLSTSSFGANKRARYWLGDRRGAQVEDGITNNDDHSPETLEHDGVEEDDYLVASDFGSDIGFNDSDYDDDDDDELDQRFHAKSDVRRMSEHMMESMEV